MPSPLQRNPEAQIATRHLHCRCEPTLIIYRIPAVSAITTRTTGIGAGLPICSHDEQQGKKREKKEARDRRFHGRMIKQDEPLSLMANPMGSIGETRRRESHVAILRKHPAIRQLHQFSSQGRRFLSARHNAFLLLHDGFVNSWVNLSKSRKQMPDLRPASQSLFSHELVERRSKGGFFRTDGGCRRMDWL